MRTFSLIIFLMAQAFASLAQLPQVKVDLSFWKDRDDTTLEPGYQAWYVDKEKTPQSKEFDGITYTFTSPDGVASVLSNGWNKTYITNAENKAKNGRLTGDGITTAPTTECGEITLTIEGLPVGTHTLQTFHSRWENPANFNLWPINVRQDGKETYTAVTTTCWEPVAANATTLTHTLTVTRPGQAVSLTFYTVESQKPATSLASNNKAPIINAFELNTASVSAQAKDPYPASGDIHADADDKTCTLRWSAAGPSVTEHRLYVGADSATVAAMTTPTAVVKDTAYLLTDLYSMNTYYWRVDEVTTDGTVTPGNVWYFRPRQLAFPGAEGYGRFATGGRGGIVYHVTKLTNKAIDADNKIYEEGSLLYGLVTLKGPRTIVFDVSGLIELDMSSYFVNSFATIACQTAPGKGICLKYSNLNINGENICRFLRARRGYGDTGNAMGLAGADHSIVDHTTAAWGTDETVSGRGAKMITFQYSMIAEALGIADHKNYAPGTNHGYAATIDGKIGSWHHNLLVHCAGRNWSMGGGMDGNNTAIGQMDIFNNVVYNWKSRTTDGGCHEVNFVNNYYKMGPDTSLKTLFTQQYENVGSAESRWQAYISGNIRENKDHTLSQDKYGDTYKYSLSNGAVDPNKRTDEYAYKTFVDKAFFPSYATIHTAQDAFKIVTSDAGATMPCRDDQHLRVVRETVDGTYTYVGSRSGIKGEIDHENDCGGFEAFPEESRPEGYDTDRDGMPNWYEALAGSNPDVADNNEDPDGDGWTRLEDFLEMMSHPYAVVEPKGTTTFDVATCFRGFTKQPVYTVSGADDLCAVSLKDNILTVQAKERGGLSVFTLIVTDAEGSTFSQRFTVAVTGDPMALPQAVSFDEADVVSREFFSIDGRKVDTFESHQTYLMRVTDRHGRQQTIKVLKD